MEPASIVGLVSGAAGVAMLAFQLSKLLIGLKDSFDHIAIRLIDLATLCRVLEVAWSEVEGWASEQAKHGQVSTAVLEQFQHCCETSKTVLEAVSDDFHRLDPTSRKSWQFGSKSKARAVLHESNLREHSATLRGQMNSLQLLISTATLSVHTGR